MKLLNKMRKKEKGFTLVEIIVVLVILAILAAFTIPTMLGFVSDANSKAKLAEAREVYVAAQSASTQVSATTGVNVLPVALASPAVMLGTSPTAASTQMKVYLGSDVDGATWTVTMSGAKVLSVVDYTRNNSTKITITPGS